MVPSSQSLVPAPLQTLAWQLALATQGLAAVHVAPSASPTVSHVPVLALQPVVVHGLPSSLQLTAELGEGLHLPPTHAHTPLHLSPSSSTSHCTSATHAQMSMLPLHAPLLHRSNAEQGLPSSHAAPLCSGDIAHEPVAGWHWLRRQGVSLSLLQVTAADRSTAQVCVALLQNAAPSQAVALVLAAQSASARQPQVLCGVVQPPLPSHVSSGVQGLPSSHLPPSGSGENTHFPVFLTHSAPKQSGASASLHLTTVDGFSSHRGLVLPVLASTCSRLQ